MNARIVRMLSAAGSKGNGWLSGAPRRAPAKKSSVVRLGFLAVFSAACFMFAVTQSHADQTGQLLSEAWQLYSNKDYGKAAEKYQAIASAMRKQGDTRSERYATALALLGTSQAKMGDIKPAKQNLQNAIQLLPNASMPWISDAHVSLGKILLGEKQVEEAFKSFSRAMEVVRQQGGENDPRLIAILAALGDCEVRRIRLPEAERWFLKAVNLADASGQGETMVYGNIAIALRDIYLATERDAEAVPFLQRLIPILGIEMGSSSSEALTARCDLAATYLKLKRRNDANEQVRAIIPIARSMTTTGSLPPAKLEEIAPRFYALAHQLVNLGLYPEASELLNVSVAIYQGWNGKGWGSNDYALVQTLDLLSESYESQGRLDEAESIYKMLLEHVDANSDDAAALWNNLGQVYRAQGAGTGNGKKLEDAEQAYRRALFISSSLKQEDPRSHATRLGNLGTVLILRNKPDEAERLLREALAIHDRKLGGKDPSISTVLVPLAAVLRMKREYRESADLARRGIAALESEYGPEDPELIPLYGSVSLAESALKNDAGAYAAAKQESEILIRRAQRKTLPKFAAEQTSGEYMDGYLDLIHSAYRLARSQPDQEQTLLAESFQIAQHYAATSAASAVLQTAAREAADSEELAGLIRKRQDLILEVATLEQEMISELASVGERQKAEKETAFRKRVAVTKAEIDEIDGLIAKRFPKYSDIAGQNAVSLPETQAFLGEREALILVVNRASSTYLWAVTHSDIRWIEIDDSGLGHEVQTLRCGLDEEEWATPNKARQCADLLGLDEQPDPSRPLPFSVGKAYELYRTLFGQVEDLIRDKRLLVVPSGPLAGLPFHVLVTKQPANALPSTFEGYRDIAWLARSHAIATLPAVSSLKALRQRTDKAQIAPEDYAGYGNPVLLGDTVSCRAPHVPDTCPAPAGSGPMATASSFGRATIRGRGGRRSADLDVFAKGPGSEAILEQVRALCPLPDTGYEIKCVAEHFDSKTRLIRLGEDATKASIKALNESGELARYRILHFATHGLLSGDVAMMEKRQGEPALVLTPPQSSADASDNGLLLASDVAGLKLNADWAVLSACNTAAGGQTGGEALSGLARAFFYAGARALLVSHWPVYSDAAVRLATGTFAELDRDPSAGRAEALQRAMIAFMDDHAQEDNAHPAVWAPFVVAGEGGR
jgi:CHAT domain-containing protein